MNDLAPVFLSTRMIEKPWGMDRLPAPFAAPDGRRIGEIWFEPPAELPQLLVKYLFVQDRLSVQVHPSDRQARAAGHGHRGKDECWVVIAARPGARLGIGFRRPLAADPIRAAALDGSIETMLDWRDAREGDVHYLPAGTVHAVGGDVCLLEIQRNSDITYRLFDYGRPRELHLDQAIHVARGEPHDPAHHFHRPAGSARLLDGPNFQLDQWIAGATPDIAGPLLVLPLHGTIAVAGHGVKPGQCALARAGRDVDIPDGAQCLTVRPTDD